MATPEEPHPLHRTQELAKKIMLRAVHSESEASLEIAKSAIAIFCQCAVRWCQERLEEYKKMEGHEEKKESPVTNPQTMIRQSILKEARELAAKRIWNDLKKELGDDFGSELSGESSVGGCSSAATRSSASSLLDFIEKREGLDQQMVVLLNEMVCACTDITNELLDSDEFAQDLHDWGIADAS